MEIPLARPDITQAEIDAVVAVLNTPWLSLGPTGPEFERRFADLCGRQYAAAMSSGTAALHLCLRAMGIGQGDEVITTPFSFIASSNCILFEGARPVFVDINPETWNIDETLIESAITDRTKAILAVDVFGQPARFDVIGEIAGRRGLRVVEDSCEALGAKLAGRPAGSLGDVGVFGFYPNKQITTGEGGMMVTDDQALTRLVISMRNQGRDDQGGWLAHHRLGYNYRLSDINSALGLAQLERLEEILSRRDRAATMYRTRLADEPRVRLQRIEPDVQMSWFVMVVCLDDGYTQEDRDRILRALNDRGIMCSNYFTPIHRQPFYVETFGYKGGEFPVCEALAMRTVALPFFGSMTESMVDHVCETLRSVL